MVYHLTDIDGGVLFDILGSGALRQVAWTGIGEPLAFLAYDADEDGRITSAHELFGNHTALNVQNGFEALRLREHANPDYIDSTDAGFSDLLLWTDTNHDGLSSRDELQPASNVFTRIGLEYTLTRQRDRFGNQFRYRGWADRIRNRQIERIQIYDIIFQTR